MVKAKSDTFFCASFEVLPYALVTAERSLIASFVVAPPAVAPFAASSRCFALSAESPNAEITSYNPSVKSFVVFPTAGDRSRMFACSAFIRSVAPGIRVCTMPKPALKSLASFAAAMPVAAIAVVATAACFERPINNSFASFVAFLKSSSFFVVSATLLSKAVLSARIFKVISFAVTAIAFLFSALVIKVHKRDIVSD